MASHIPLALSLLHTVATQYPGFQKSQPTPPTTSSTSTPQMSTQSAPSIAPSVTPSVASNPRPAPLSNSQAVNVTPSSSSASNPPPSASNLCDNCHLKPKHYDGTKTHMFCSKSCAKTKLGGQQGTQATNSSGNCDYCHSRPKYFDGTRTHSFCGKACAANAALAANGSTKATCQAPGCQKPVFCSNGSYCSLSHKTLAETVCLMCRQNAKMANSHFCSKTCADDAEKKGPMILEVPQGHVTFKSVEDQFKASWRHTNSVCPPVRRIYKILAPQASLANYNAYRATVEARGQFVASGRSAGNENRRWHGTRRECLLGDKGHAQFCASSTCSLCCIIRTSFDLSMFGKKTGWGRFGKGIYTSSTSSKSNDYSQNDCKSPLKAILLNKVIVGKGCKLTHDNTTLTAPPPGYDSVLAEKGGTLNYDELVVYTEDAIRPSFLVMYEP